jgi:hypothetical protein
MHNQRAGLSQVLAEQHISQRREQATHARLARGWRMALPGGAGRGWSVAGGSRLGGHGWPQTSPPAVRKPAMGDTAP